jgi:purine-nucleoside phosphorylase
MNALARALGPLKPEFAIVLGSSLGGLADAIEMPRIAAYSDIPGFPQSRVSGHAGRLVAGRLGGRTVAVLQGRAHPYETGDAAIMRPAIEMLAGCGVSTLILTNAAGSLDTAMRAGSLMLIEDHINLSGMNPLIGIAGDRSFVPMTDAYDPPLRETMLKAAADTGLTLHRGVYAWFSGPSFETPAEIRMAQRLGARAIGMSTAPETILARYCGLRVVAVSVITNLGAGLEGAAPSHDETKREGEKAAQRMGTLLTRFLETSA